MNVSLKSNHLCLDAEVIASLFGNDTYVLLSYQDQEKRLLAAPVTNTWFSKLHPADQYFLKVKNKEGDCAAPIHNLILDHDLDHVDRDLPFEVNHQSKYLKIDIS